MTNNETARRAREWAIFALTVPGGSPGSRAAAEHILATTTEPTMADIIWDDEEHTLTGATVEFNGKPEDLVMLSKDRDSFITYATLDGEVDCEYQSCFTPNGKRYELREVGAEETAHPEYLETLEDYENAPEGTVAEKSGCFAWTKIDGDWRDGGTWLSSSAMAGTERAMLREGWGK